MSTQAWHSKFSDSKTLFIVSQNISLKKIFTHKVVKAKHEAYTLYIYLLNKISQTTVVMHKHIKHWFEDMYIYIRHLQYMAQDKHHPSMWFINKEIIKS
jgi:hypothetical protein